MLGLKSGGASVTTGIIVPVEVAVVIGLAVADGPGIVVDGMPSESVVSGRTVPVEIALLPASEDPVEAVSLSSGTGSLVVSSPQVVG